MLNLHISNVFYAVSFMAGALLLCQMFALRAAPPRIKAQCAHTLR